MAFAYYLSVPMKNFLRGVALVATMASPAIAQFPRLAPPPPCKATGPAPSYLTYWNSAAARDNRPKVVVFALEPQVDDANRLYLAVAVPERIRQRLARDSRIQVATEASVTRALSEARSRQDTAVRILDADYVLSGKLLVDGERQEVQLVLTKPGQAAAVWQASFRATSALRSVEESAVRGLARALRLPSVPEMPNGWPTTDGGYDALLAGDAFMRSPTRTGTDSALFYYGRALTLEPASSVAALRLARASVTILERGDEIPGYPGTAGPQRVNELIARSVASETSSEALTVKAMLSRVTDPVRFNGAIPLHLRAVKRQPNDADAEHEYGVTLMRLGDIRAAETHFRRALALSPGRANTLAALAAMELQGRRWNAACALSNASIAAWPYDPSPYATRAEARLHLSDGPDAFSDAELVRRLATGAWPEALRILIVNGTHNIDDARSQIVALTAAYLSPGRELAVRDAEYMARAYLTLGDQRRAVESLRRARPVGTDLRVALRGPLLSPLRSDTAVARMIIEAEGRDRR
jgi:tetratricopeptide (TPR) repeat protein/TolB-like protein